MDEDVENRHAITQSDLLSNSLFGVTKGDFTRYSFVVLLLQNLECHEK